MSVSLDDKYTATEGRIFLSGIQALVRLPMVQRWRDQAAGLNTAGFISGYRGSPLGGLDEALWAAGEHLSRHHVRFQPGLNEDLALTAVWGTQQVDLIGPARYDGVFSLWYGKGPGVDRCVDVMKHMNHAGTCAKGGVLMVAGDDHGAYSSTLPHQSEHVFAAAMIPVLYPCNVQEYLELGLHGWAMSRFSGCVVGFKALADTVESSTRIDADPFAVITRLPADFAMPAGGLNARLSTDTLGVQARRQEALMQDYKIYAALAYARENRLNRTMIDSPRARLGIVACGKSYLDVLEALEELGIDESQAAEIGLRVFKVSMPWPLEPDGIREFAQGLEEILVVEEKRQIVEYQLKEQLYNWRSDVRPRVIGKFDEKGEWVHPRGQWLLAAKADFSVAQIARVIAARIARFHDSQTIRSRLRFLDEKALALDRVETAPPRPAYFCSGCPHNRSTRVPQGSLALAGIGCHVMSTAIYPEFNKTTTHMGGEGAPWIGQAAFSEHRHVFANLGDGTYFHSGALAIRAAIASGVNITYKILYNSAVAMTGGQPVEGQPTVSAVAQQVAAEGVKRIALVTEDLSRYAGRKGLPEAVTLHDRKDLDAVQRALREVPGTSVLIYDQVCAAEKRRKRKKADASAAPDRIFIHPQLCEGCGDCGAQSNCTSILPLKTELGLKRIIDQSSCNLDHACVQGLCPSLVTVKGARLRRKAQARLAPPADLPPPPAVHFSGVYNILVTGIGGTGVITIGALLGMAAHLEGGNASVLDMTGMSQKNGAVTSHVRLAGVDQPIRAQRIATGEADLVLGCDLLTAAGAEALSKMRPGRTRAIVNSHEQPTGAFARDPNWVFPTEQVRSLLNDAVGAQVDYLDATALATALMGDAIAANLFMLGWGVQRGAIPLRPQSLERAIELNGVAVSMNRAAFAWGRRAAIAPLEVEQQARPSPSRPGGLQPVMVHRMPELQGLIARRVAFLTRYQDARYAARYEAFVGRVREAERTAGLGERLSRAVAENLFKLMAYKDEYEVARLFVSAEFRKALSDEFEDGYSLAFHLAPPGLARRDSQGRPVKIRVSGAAMPVFSVLARLRFLRGGRFDVFGYSKERRLERALIAEYRASIEDVLSALSKRNHAVAVRIAKIPEQIRGFGEVKHASIALARAKTAELRARFDAAGSDGSGRGEPSVDLDPVEPLPEDRFSRTLEVAEL
jgi:indolepyruvate ferredoxin oxidoreductase